MLNIFRRNKKNNIPEATPEKKEEAKAPIVRLIEKRKKRINYGPDKRRDYVKHKRRIRKLQKIARRIQRRREK